MIEARAQDAVDELWPLIKDALAAGYDVDITISQRDDEFRGEIVVPWKRLKEISARQRRQGVE